MSLESDYQTTKKTFKANGLATLIGSLPLSDHAEALDLIIEHTPEIPLWPQLPTRLEERMMVQFSEGLPGLIETEAKAYFQTTNDDFQNELLVFFENYLKVIEDKSLLADSQFQISKHRAPGLYKLLEKSPSFSLMKALKGQITGPFTLLTGLTDQDQRLAYYDQTLREVGVKAVAIRAAWQVEYLKKSGQPVLLFIDEPALAGLGSSSFIGVAKEDIAADLTESIDAIHKAGGLAGIHVCANTDWNLLLNLKLDIISFDAHGFFNRFITCKEGIINFLDNGGIIAWGGIPTSNTEDIEKEDVSSLTRLWNEQMQQLVCEKYSISQLLQQTLITPSCGTGSLNLIHAKKVLELCKGVSENLRQQHLSDD